MTQNLRVKTSSTQEFSRALFEARQLYFKFDEFNDRWCPSNERLAFFPDAVNYQINKLTEILLSGDNKSKIEAAKWLTCYKKFEESIESKKSKIPTR